MTHRAGPQLARYSINTTAVPGSVLTARSSINQALRVWNLDNDGGRNERARNFW
jgi:hypothetical protein